MSPGAAAAPPGCRAPGGCDRLGPDGVRRGRCSTAWNAQPSKTVSAVTHESWCMSELRRGAGGIGLAAACEWPMYHAGFVVAVFLCPWRRERRRCCYQYEVAGKRSAAGVVPGRAWRAWRVGCAAPRAGSRSGQELPRLSFPAQGRALARASAACARVLCCVQRWARRCGGREAGAPARPSVVFLGSSVWLTFSEQQSTFPGLCVLSKVRCACRHPCFG